jgi:hypothetical protein
MPVSSCTTCHEIQAPVANNGEWHIQHAGQDICINCHGGNGGIMDENLAHAGMVAQPLGDVYTDCHSCHPDYAERAVPYAATLQIVPSSCVTPTPVVVSKIAGGLPPSSISMPSTLMAAASSARAFLLIIGGLAVLSMFCLGIYWLERHPVRR